MRSKILFNNEADELIKVLVSNKKSIDFITIKLEKNLGFKCSRSSVARHINELGLDISNNKSRKLKFNEDELVDYLFNGLSYDEIANELECNVDDLRTFAGNHDISSKVENKKLQYETWIGDDVTVDLRLVNDNVIDEIYNSLNCDLIKNATVEINNKKFIVDFYSEKYNIAFICCVNNDQISRSKSISKKGQSNWITKINEDSFIKAIPYFYINTNSVVDYINDLMTEPEYIDVNTEITNGYTRYLDSFISPVKDSIEQREFEKAINHWNKVKEDKEKQIEENINYHRLDCFKYEDRIYDREGFRLIDFDTLIININPETGEKLNQTQKDNLLKLVKENLSEQYEYLLGSAKNKKKIELEGEDHWNYRCGRRLLDMIKDENKSFLKF